MQVYKLYRDEFRASIIMYQKETASDELDMVDRDPFEINNHIRVILCFIKKTDLIFSYTFLKFYTNLQVKVG